MISPTATPPNLAFLPSIQYKIVQVVRLLKYVLNSQANLKDNQHGMHYAVWSWKNEYVEAYKS